MGGGKGNRLGATGLAGADGGQDVGVVEVGEGGFADEEVEVSGVGPLHGAFGFEGEEVDPVVAVAEAFVGDFAGGAEDGVHFAEEPAEGFAELAGAFFGVAA